MRRWRLELVGAAALVCVALMLGYAATRPKPACVRQDFEGAPFTVCAFDASGQDLRLALAGAGGQRLRTFRALADALGAERPRVDFAMNAGMFNESGAPIGLFIANGDEIHPISTATGGGNFGLQPNGVFSADADGTLHIDTTSAYLARAPHPAWATQSGPMLVIGGQLHPSIQQEGPSRHVRNGVGITDPRRAYFVISDQPVSFGRFARFFRDELKCTDALYFDGSVSSLWAPRLHRRDEHAKLGPMVVVLGR